MKLRFCFGLVFFAVSVLRMPAEGQIYVSQSPVSGGGVLRTSQLWQDPTPAGNNLDGDAVCWENFTLTSTATINHIEVWGSGASELGFQVEFWKQDPGTIAYQPLGVFYYGQGNPPISPEPPGFLTVTPRMLPGPGGLTHYILDLPTPVTLAANDSTNPRWFVGVVGLTAQPYVSWNWAQGTGGSNNTFQFIRGGTLAGGDLFHILPEGRALVLSHNVPAPGGLYTALIGVVSGISLSTRRRRKSSHCPSC